MNLWDNLIWTAPSMNPWTKEKPADKMKIQHEMKIAHHFPCSRSRVPGAGLERSLLVLEASFWVSWAELVSRGTRRTRTRRRRAAAGAANERSVALLLRGWARHHHRVTWSGNEEGPRNTDAERSDKMARRFLTGTDTVERRRRGCTTFTYTLNRRCKVILAC